MAVTAWMMLTVLSLLIDQGSTATSLPFNIPGPRSLKDRIAIVGAGPSGIDMAVRLKKLGFENIDILEKERWFGGKSWTINYRGAAHEMGTVYLAPDYKDNIVELVNKYVPGDLVSLPPAGIWLDNVSGPLSFDQYVLMYVMNHFKIKDPRAAVQKMVGIILKYNKLHNDILGRYDGEIMPEPTKENMYEIRGTFIEFLKRNELEVLAPLLYASNTVQGYGRLDEIACLYGMMWNTPNLMNGILRRLTRQSTDTGLYMLKNGFYNLWSTMVKKENLRITKNVEIIQVYRSISSSYENAWIKMRVNGGKKKWKHYDFLIWSPEMKTSLKYWRNDEISDELFYFSRTYPKYFSTALVDTKGAQRGPSPIDYWVDNMKNKSRDSSLWAQRDSYATNRGFNGSDYQSGNLPTGNDGKSMRTTVTYQMGDREPLYQDLRKILRTSLKKIGATKINIKILKTWRYFPRFSPADMSKGYIWRVLEMQGKYGMWYIGSSVCFESVKSVVEYNKLLLKNYIVPAKGVR